MSFDMAAYEVKVDRTDSVPQPGRAAVPGGQVVRVRKACIRQTEATSTR